MDLLFGLVLAVLVVVAFTRLRRRAAARSDGLSDEAIRQIETAGQLERDDPLDFDEIEREHREYFEETWDEPEEY